MTGRGGAISVALMAVMAHSATAQDTAAVMRHLLALDISRVQPFQRTYDMVVRLRDSAVVIGQRDIALSGSAYSGAPAWLLVETRTGLVPSVESLYVAPDLRPLHWSSALGEARIGAEFVGDTIYGAATMQAAKQNLVLNSRPDLLVSSSMLETLLPLLPLTSNWADSVGVLGVDLSASQVVAAELAVVAEEDVAIDSSSSRPTWVIALRSGPHHVLVWVDKESGAVLKSQQSLPAHVGSELEYRLRPERGTAPPR